MADAPSLAALEAQLHALITARDAVAATLAVRGLSPAVVGDVIASDERLDAVSRLDVYANMYFVRLLEILRLDFPKLAVVLSSEAFHELVTEYLLAHPSTNPSVRHVGVHLASFLGNGALVGRAWWTPWLGDLARLEWARGDAFDAADAEPLLMERLTSLPPDAFPALPLQVVPSAQVIAASARVDEVWRAIEAGEEPVAPTPEPVRLLVWRRDGVVYHRAVDDDEAGDLAIAAAGTRFEALCERIAARVPDPATAAELAFARLVSWTTQGLLRDVP